QPEGVSFVPPHRLGRPAECAEYGVYGIDAASAGFLVACAIRHERAFSCYACSTLPRAPTSECRSRLGRPPPGCQRWLNIDLSNTSKILLWNVAGVWASLLRSRREPAAPSGDLPGGAHGKAHPLRSGSLRRDC